MAVVEQKEQQNSPVVDVSKIRQMDEGMIHIWLFGLTSPNSGYQLYICPIGVDTYILMQQVDENSHIYYGRWDTGGTHENDNNHKLVFRLCMISNSDIYKFQKSGQLPKLEIIKGPNDCNYARNEDYNGWLIPKSQSVFLLDFKNYDKRAFTLTSTKEAMKLHYGKIMQLVLSYLLSKCNSEIAPGDCIAIVFQLYSLICIDCKVNGGFIKKAMNQECSTCVTEKRIKAAKNWHELATPLTSMFLLTSIGSKKTTYLNKSELTVMYSKFTNSALFRDGEYVIEQLSNLLGEYVAYFQTRFFNRIIYSPLPITKFHYVLWYNLLNQKVPDSNINKRINLIYNNLKPTRSINELYDLVVLDMHFGFDYRCVPIEYELLKILLYSRNRARGMLDYWYKLLNQINNLETFYEILFSKQVEIVQFLGDAGVDERAKQSSFGNWYEFLTFLLNKCDIARNVSEESLDTLSRVKKKLLSFVATLFAPQIDQINSKDDGDLLYNLLSQYPILLEENVREAVGKNDTLSNQFQDGISRKLQELETQARNCVNVACISTKSRLPTAGKIMDTVLKMIDIANEMTVSIPIRDKTAPGDIKEDEDGTGGDEAVESMIQGKLLEYMFPKSQTYEEMIMKIRKNDGGANMGKSEHKVDEASDGKFDYKTYSDEINEWIKSTQEIESKSDIKQFGQFSQNYETILKNVTKQISRLSQTSKKIKTILQTKFEINQKIKQLEKDLNVKQKENDNLIHDVNQMHDELQKIKKQVEENHRHFVQLMTSHETAVTSRISTEEKVSTLKNRLKQEKSELNECESLLKKYRNFKKDTKQVDQVMNKLFQDKLNEFESQWLKWDENDLLFWFKYKLNWFETSINVHEKKLNDNSNDSKEEDDHGDEMLIDFDRILSNLQKQRIRGKFVSVLDKSDLNNLGFQLMKHQLAIYTSIQNLVLKYPIPVENVNDYIDEEGIEGQVATGGMVSGSGNYYDNNNNKLDEKYLCPLSKRLLRDPIIASNGTTYERSALESYLRQYKKLPDSDVVISDIDEEMENWFVDDDLKTEINAILE